MKTLLTIALLVILVSLAAPALAKPVIKVNLKAETEVIETVDGKEVVKIVPVEEIAPGQTIIYTLEVINSGDQPATNVKVTDPIPEETSLIIGSVFGDESETTYSIDGGQTYKQPSLLTYKVDRGDGTFENRIASPEQYTNIKWLLETVPAGNTRTVGFKALVK